MSEYYNSSNYQHVANWNPTQAPIGGVYADNGSPIDSYYIDNEKNKVWPNVGLRSWFPTPGMLDMMVQRVQDGVGDKFVGLEDSDFYDTSADKQGRAYKYFVFKESETADTFRIPAAAILNMICLGWDVQEHALFDERKYQLGMDAPTKIAWDDKNKVPVPVCIPKAKP
jgi:hypothetical protein